MSGEIEKPRAGRKGELAANGEIPTREWCAVRNTERAPTGECPSGDLCPFPAKRNEPLCRSGKIGRIGEGDGRALVVGPDQPVRGILKRPGAGPRVDSLRAAVDHDAHGIAAGWSVTQTYDVTAWSCWTINLLIAELILRRNEKGAPRGALRPDWSGR